MQDDDLEEGEVKDPSDRKIRPRPVCRFFIKGRSWLKTAAQSIALMILSAILFIDYYYSVEIWMEILGTVHPFFKDHIILLV